MSDIRSFDFTPERHIHERKSTQFYEQIFDHIDIDIAIFDNKLHYEYVNPKAIRDKKIRKWIIGKNDVDYCLKRNVSLKIAEKRQEILAKVFTTGVPSAWDETLTNRSGEVIHIYRKVCPIFDDQGSVIRVIGYGLDITERRTTEERLRKSENQYRTLFESIPVPTREEDFSKIKIYLDVRLQFRTLSSMGEFKDYIMSTPDLIATIIDLWQITDFNQAVREFYNISTIEELNSLIRNEMKTNHKFTEFFVDLLANMYYLGKTNLQQELTTSLLDPPRHIIIRWSVPEEAQHNLSKVIVTIIDITELKQTQHEQFIMLTELQRINVELDEFVIMASHDLKGPLRKIHSFNQLLRNKLRGQLDEEGKHYLGFILDGSRQMQTMIDNISKLSQIRHVNLSKEIIDLKQVLNDLLNFELAHSLAEKFVKIIIHENLPVIQGNKSQIRQLFQNLISNAIKFSQSRSDPIIEITGVDKSTGQIIKIKDNGIGIDKKDHDKIFLPFQRMNSKFPGTGVGLTICKKIAELHNASINVESAINEGSTFIVSFPKMFE